jgi:Fic family protein
MPTFPPLPPFTFRRYLQYPVREYRINNKPADTDMTTAATHLMEWIRKKRERLDALRPLDRDLVEKLHEEMRVLHTYNSNAIEGNTLTLSETKLVVNEGITIGGKTLREHLEATNNAQGYDLIVRLAREQAPINHVTVQQIHEVVTRGILESAGRYRTHNVRITGAVRSPPDGKHIVREMDELTADSKEQDRSVIDMTAYLHHRFAAIHPFIDGNGRVARLLGNLYLIRHGYPPIVLDKKNRQQYYQALREADNGDLSVFTTFIARAVNESLSHYLTIAGGKEILIPLGELAKVSPYSQEYLSLAARKGLLDATKIGDTWYATWQALDDYIREHGRK